MVDGNIQLDSELESESATKSNDRAGQKDNMVDNNEFQQWVKNSFVLGL